MNQNEDLMAGEEGLADALVTVAVQVREREAPFAGRTLPAKRNEGAEVVVGRVTVLPAELAEGLREPRRLNRPAKRARNPSPSIGSGLFRTITAQMRSLLDTYCRIAA
jgi:hypothetical protein